MECALANARQAGHWVPPSVNGLEIFQHCSRNRGLKQGRPTWTSRILVKCYYLGRVVLFLLGTQAIAVTSSIGEPASVFVYCVHCWRLRRRAGRSNTNTLGSMVQRVAWTFLSAVLASLVCLIPHEMDSLQVFHSFSKGPGPCLHPLQTNRDARRDHIHCKIHPWQSHERLVMRA